MNQHQPDNRLVPVQESDRIRYIQFSERMFVPPQQIAPCKPQRNCRGCIHPINPCTTDNGICYFSSHTAMPASRITGCVGVCAVTPEEMEKRLQDARAEILEEPHISQYIERIRMHSKTLKNAPLREIISVSLMMAADHYESLQKSNGEKP